MATQSHKVGKTCSEMGDIGASNRGELFILKKWDAFE